MKTMSNLILLLVRLAICMNLINESLFNIVI